MSDIPLEIRYNTRRIGCAYRGGRFSKAIVALIDINNMPSTSFQTWRQRRIAELDEIENAHQRVGGSQRGRRYATQQINHAYAMLLSSQFQGFCRDLHSEAADHIVRAVDPVVLRPVLRVEFTLNRQLDRGNPHPGVIGADFNRLGLDFWGQVHDHDRRNQTRQNHLDDLNTWRNAIAHQDFDPIRLGGTIRLGLTRVRTWRTACEHLAVSFDEVMRGHVEHFTGSSPWVNP